MTRAAAALALGLAALAGPARADEPAVTYYAGGALSVRCADAPLAAVLERIQATTGVALIVEGNDDTMRLTADVPALPVAQAIARLLEGTGIGYLLVADPADASRIAKLYVSAGKQTPAPSASAPAPAPSDRGAAALPPGLPQPVVDAIAQAEAEEGGEVDEEIVTDAPPVEVEKPRAAPGPGVQPVLDPFGRPIPMRQGAGDRRPGRDLRRGGQAQ